MARWASEVLKQQLDAREAFHPLGIAALARQHCLAGRHIRV